MKSDIQINLIWLYPMTSTSNSSLLWFQKQDFTESSFNHQLQWEHYRSYLIKQILLCVFFCDTVLCFQIEPKIGPIEKCNFLDFGALFIYTLFCLSTCPIPLFPYRFQKDCSHSFFIFTFNVSIPLLFILRLQLLIILRRGAAEEEKVKQIHWLTQPFKK